MEELVVVEEEEEEEPWSECCGYPIIEDMDICSKCLEHV